MDEISQTKQSAMNFESDLTLHFAMQFQVVRQYKWQKQG